MLYRVRFDGAKFPALLLSFSGGERVRGESKQIYFYLLVASMKYEMVPYYTYIYLKRWAGPLTVMMGIHDKDKFVNVGWNFKEHYFRTGFIC
jgi:hypothetical protein